MYIFACGSEVNVRTIILRLNLIRLERRYAFKRGKGTLEFFIIGMNIVENKYFQGQNLKATKGNFAKCVSCWSWSNF